jgi:hypothetical protein
LSALSTAADSHDTAQLGAALVNFLQGDCEPEPDWDDSEGASEASRRAAQRQTLTSILLFALRGHSLLYDEREVMSWLVGAQRNSIRQLLGPSLPSWFDLRGCFARWRANRRRAHLARYWELWPMWLYTYGSGLPVLSDDPFEWLETACSEPTLPDRPDEKVLAELRKKVQAASNPIGRLVVTYIAPGNRDLVPRYIEAELRLTLLIVALRIHELECGKLPRSLSGLVKSGILSRVPDDPFTHRRFYYNASDGYVWSEGDAHDMSRTWEKPGDPCMRRFAWQMRSKRPNVDIAAGVGTGGCAAQFDKQPVSPASEIR